MYEDYARLQLPQCVLFYEAAFPPPTVIISPLAIKLKPLFLAADSTALNMSTKSAHHLC